MPFNGRALFSIKQWTSGSHLSGSLPIVNRALHRKKKCGRNMSLESNDFKKRLRQGGGRITLSGKQTDIFHILFQTTLHASLKLWLVPKCWRITRFRSTHASSGFIVASISAYMTEGLHQSWEGIKLNSKGEIYHYSSHHKVQQMKHTINMLRLRSLPAILLLEIHLRDQDANSSITKIGTQIGTAVE